MSQAWSGGKGDAPRKRTPNNKQATAKNLGCGWCEFYLAIKRECFKPKDERCPKDDRNDNR